MHAFQPAKFSSTIRCPICGQEFFIYAVSAVDMMSRRVIEHALRSHHTPRLTTARAHPDSTFSIRNWSGAQPFLASAVPGDLLDQPSNLPPLPRQTITR
jgi:hypothetical protein